MEEKFTCPVYKKCGGCQLDVTYAQQLSYKTRTIRRQLGRYGRIEPIIGMEDPLHYRCKVSTAFGYSRGRVLSGVWQSSSGKLVTVESCGLEDERAAAIIKAIKVLLPVFKLRTYDERDGSGFLRFVTIRIGKKTGEILVALGTGSRDGRSREAFVRALVKKCPEITTVVQCISTDKLNLILGREETVMYGPGYITDELCGKIFRISARSFFQVNPVQTEALYKTAVEYAGLTGKETVIDAYCGVGTVGIIAAEKARCVIAAEINGDAVKNARENAALNKIENINFIKADAGDFMEEMAEAGESADVVFTDPPRAGCSKKFLASLVKLAPKKIVYISCNPETQSRDLYFLTQNGYTVNRMRPVDMFPYTKHTEMVACLVREG